MIIRKTAYPRAGLVGNPSDGFFGKTISFTFSDFRAEVVLYETPDLEILPNTRDHSVFSGIASLAEDVRHFGYYGGIRLLKATVKRFHDYCSGNGLEMHDRNFTLRYESNIPHLVGLAGSSAIITACLRALMVFYGVDIPMPEQANLVLSVERSELGISAGLQDRVAQVYEGLVYMDFSREIMDSQGHGRYEYLDESVLPPLYIAYLAELSEGSEIVHNDLRSRFARGDEDIVEAVAFWVDLTDRVKECLVEERPDDVGGLLDANFDRRAEVCRISEGNREMIGRARSVGASAKFTGSGGAIIGTYKDDAMLAALKETLHPLGVEVIRPEIIRTPGGRAA